MTTSIKPIRETQRLASATSADDDVRPTDILFNCPHCGHNLCIDCHGAGLLTNCTDCHKEIMVPIPEGMNSEDLDLRPDQTIGQLFYTRRLLARAEKRIAELEEVVASLKERRTIMEKARLTSLHHCADLANLCQTLQRNQSDTAAVLNRMVEIIANEQQH